MPALTFLLLLIGTSLLPSRGDGDLLLGFRLLIAGCGLIAALPLSSGFGRHLLRTLRLPLVLVAVLAAFLLLQILPFAGLANPIWLTTAEALAAPISGHITVDVGRTAAALAETVLVLATIVLAAMVALDRRRAALVLWALAAVSAAGALLKVLAQGERSAALITAMIALILLCASIDVLFERASSPARSLMAIVRASIPTLLACFCALVACEFLLIALASPALIFVSVCGTGFCVGCILFYRLRWTVTTGSALFLTALLAGVGIVGATYPVGTPLPLAFAAEAPSEPLRALLADTPWAGQGAGASAEVGSAYLRLDSPNPFSIPTAAARLVVELGLPASVAIAVAGLLVCAWLWRGAFERNRDAAFAIAGAAVVLELVMASFVTDAVPASSAVPVAAALVGLASVQSRSLRA